ncbi:MAG: hypothetical protein MUP90_10245, partial [Gammaproteobacteria bacterium]|nr:hypothetical protein [Gammaproteobacteria bacterium]
RKDGSMYYAFYAESYSGQVELRGLESARYQVTDYFAGKDLGMVGGPSAKIDVAFNRFLLVQASPVGLQ